MHRPHCHGLALGITPRDERAGLWAVVCHDTIRNVYIHVVPRISAAQIPNIAPQEFEELVFLYVVRDRKPLVIEKWNDHLPKSLFAAGLPFLLTIPSDVLELTDQ